jgi:hypothetical protein
LCLDCLYILKSLRKKQHCLKISQKSSFLKNSLGEKLGLVVRAEGSRPRGRGFEFCCILDGCKSNVSSYIFNEKGNKGSQMGHTKKIFKKKKKKKE